MAFWAGLFKKTDIIVATSPQFFTAVAGGALGFFKRIPWVFEVRDLWPESIRAVNALKQSKILDALEQLELFLYRPQTQAEHSDNHACQQFSIPSLYKAPLQEGSPEFDGRLYRKSETFQFF